MMLYIGLAILVTVMALPIENRMAPQLGGVTTRGQMRNRILLLGMFVLLAAVSAIRVNVGNDYAEYVEIFQSIHQGARVSTEPGFNFVVLAVQFCFGTGVVADRILFALFAFGTVYFMLRAIYEQSSCFSFSVFLFMANGYYFSSMTSMRYYFVLAIALFSMKYALREKWLPFIAWIVFASLFHKSVLFVIPMYFLATRAWKKWHVILLAGFCVSCLFLQEFYRKIIFLFYPFYENSVYDTQETSGINIIKCAAIIALALVYYRQTIKDDRENKFYLLLMLESLVLYAFCSFIPVISRVGYYLNIAGIFLVPSVLKGIPVRWQRRALYVCTVGAYVLYFMFFLRKAGDAANGLLPYQSWLF